jgi:hypothetical protein
MRSPSPKAVFDRNVLTFDKPCIFQTLTECGQELRGVAGCPRIVEPIIAIAGCCARAASGQAAAPPPSKVMRYPHVKSQLSCSFSNPGTNNFTQYVGSNQPRRNRRATMDTLC